MKHHHSHPKAFLAAAAALLCVTWATFAAAPVNPFFAMDTAMRSAEFRNPATAVPLLKKMGYDGIGPAMQRDLKPWVEQLDKNHMTMFAVYLPVNVDPPDWKLDPAWTEAMKLLAGRPTVVWVSLISKKFKPSSTDGDKQVVRILRTIADEADKFHLRVSIYPHYHLYAQTIDDTLRLVGKAKRNNIGITFNLCHWLRTEPKADLRATLVKARPHLNMVTINGADVGGTDWRQLIQPLGQGTYDVKQVLDALSAVNYTGPIGFQGFGIRADSRVILQTTMDAWKKYHRKPPR